MPRTVPGMLQVLRTGLSSQNLLCEKSSALGAHDKGSLSLGWITPSEAGSVPITWHSLSPLCWTNKSHVQHIHMHAHTGTHVHCTHPCMHTHAHIHVHTPVNAHAPCMLMSIHKLCLYSLSLYQAPLLLAYPQLWSARRTAISRSA